jgi:hypothetical protein
MIKRLDELVDNEAHEFTDGLYAEERAEIDTGASNLSKIERAAVLADYCL